MNKKKTVAAIVGILLGVLVACLPTPEGLTRISMITLGVTVWAIIYWVFQVQNIFVTAIIMSLLFVVLKCASFGVVFSAFSGATWWFVIGVLGMSCALGRSGVMKRFAYYIMRLFPATFAGQVLGMIVAGFIINPLIPSTAAKLSICVPISVGMAQVMGFDKRSKGMHGLFLAAIVGVMLMSVCFLSANIWGTMTYGLLPAETQAQFSWINWFLAIIPWGLVVAAGCYFLIVRMYKPEVKTTFSKQYIEDELKNMGPMSKKEKITLIIFVVAILLWATEKLHGIYGCVVAMGALIALIVTNILTVDDFKKGIPWDVVFLSGAMIGLGGVLQSVGIQDYISSAVAPYVSRITGNPYIFVAAIAIILYVVRIVYVEQVSTVNIFVLLFIPFAIQAGINPWISSMVVFTSLLNWNLIHQNLLMITAYSVAGGEEYIDYKSIARLSTGYMILNIIGFWVCIPIWQLTGIL